MKILKDSILEVRHQRSGKWIGIAREDFDTDSENEFYPINLHQEEDVHGMSRSWIKGDEMPCRKGLCTFKQIGHVVQLNTGNYPPPSTG